MPTPPHRADAAWQAFSLVEVALALGVVSFAFITIFALLPLGLTSNHNSLDETQAMNLLQSIIADRKATALSSPSAVYALPALSTLTATTTGKLYLAVDGSSSPSLTTHSLYQVNYTIHPGAVPAGMAAYQPTVIDFVVTWPAAATGTTATSQVETVATFLP